MKAKDRAAWQEQLAENQDDYGKPIGQYAEKWADLMEARMAAGQTIEECAGDTSPLAAAGLGISGFQHELAVVALVEAWQYGEELRGALDPVAARAT